MNVYLEGHKEKERQIIEENPLKINWKEMVYFHNLLQI